MKQDRSPHSQRRLRGATAYHAGASAEDAAERLYLGQGFGPAVRRWRGKSGEIDLIIRDGAGLIFVEVKRGRTIEQAAERIGQRQIERIFRAASEFAAKEPNGELTEMRFDLALVDDRGTVEIRPNALAG